ncbi:MAG TPA: DUF2937 family protein [Opitutaceae bacterium]|nr:DUF2937 family protein [Opitutaceae bacterium]
MFRRTAAAGFSAIEGFLDRVVCVLGAVFAAQAPEFFQQYLQRLGGHLDEVRRQLAAFESAAQAAGKPWPQFVADTSANADPGLAKLGHTMAATAERAEHLAAAHAAMFDASDWTRPWAFLTHLDAEIARATATVFKPAVPTTVESAVYAGVGVALAFAAWHFAIRLPLRHWLRAQPPRSAVVDTTTRA